MPSVRLESLKKKARSKGIRVTKDTKSGRKALTEAELKRKLLAAKKKTMKVRKGGKATGIMNKFREMGWKKERLVDGGVMAKLYKVQTRTILPNRNSFISIRPAQAG